MTLKSGRYLARLEREVIFWPAPDVNGDGPAVEDTHFDAATGRQMGRRPRMDGGRPVHSYLPPEGFEDRRNWEGVANFVKVDERGNVVRQPNDEAIVIAPGQALIINPDGSVETLDGEWEQYVFSQVHDKVDGEKAGDATDVVNETAPSQDISDHEYYEQMRAQLASWDAQKAKG